MLFSGKNQNNINIRKEHFFILDMFYSDLELDSSPEYTYMQSHHKNA